MKKQSGITLVALIITIIVMVILVGVVIVSAVADGGIIDRAQSAMKEKERAEAEELVIASYIYKTTASRTTIVALDLEETADAIYENLIANGFILIGVNSGEELYIGGDKIELNIQGKHGNYTGTITEKGLENGLKVQDENKTITDENESVGGTVDEDEITEEKILWMYTEKSGYVFIGNVEKLTLTINTEIKYGIPTSYNEESGEFIYDEIYTIKVEDVPEDELFLDSFYGSVGKLIIGAGVPDKVAIGEESDITEVVFLDGCKEIKGINLGRVEVITIPETVTIIRSGVFKESRKQMEIHFGGSMETWNKFEISDLLSGTQIKCSDGTITIE